MEPVGEGAIRVTTGFESDISVGPIGKAAPLSTLRKAADSLARIIAAEVVAQRDRWTLWAPVAFGLGAAGYLALRTEPSLWLVATAAGLAIGLALAVRRAAVGALAIPAVLLAFAAAGLCAGKLRATLVAAPVIAEQSIVTLEGWVVDVASPGAGGARLVVAPVQVSGLDPRATPVRVRVTLRGEPPTPPPGSPIRLRAMLGPPPPPASPGAYDFARDAWFDRVGGVGFSLGEPAEATLSSPPRRLRLAMAVNAARWSLAQRIVARLGVEQGGVAAAMVTGHEAWIPPEQVEAMRASGLAHILSISGLHMAIVGGFVFAAVRLGVAAWPWLALRANGKKVAALAGLFAIGGYLVISGAPPPAERAAITGGVMFLAVLADRQAISLRALAVAALAILALQPEAAATPGFQMSFAATAALVALAEAWPQPVKEIETPWWIRWPQAAVVWTGAALAASFVAGLATGPFAMHHFNRVASYGLIANLLVSPLSSFVIMPFLALGAALEPLGLGGPFLAIAGWGIGMMTDIGAGVAGRPGATVTVPSAPAAALPIAFVGIMILCLWKGRLRWLGAPLAAAVLLWPRPPAPDVWIADDGAAVAVRHDDRAVLLRPDARRFAADLWSRRRGLVIDVEAEAARDALYACGRFDCMTRDGQGVAAWAGKQPPKAAVLERLCAPGRLVVLRSPAPAAGCEGAFVLAAEDFTRGGSAELWRTGAGWKVRWANDLRGDRPWVR
ncbi:competence protein ComEC [Caulobacter mirabilis]|uniref:Competence protein ComEC n=1 Tax=Caulobacter mirabilis TaxID=69666 RepID=A0A2D2AXZ3_9CAUL|nr:competence protein ComEC [Caulobacter mirabilis]